MSLRIVTPTEAKSSYRETDGHAFVIRDYFGSFQDVRPGLQVFEVDRIAPRGRIEPHFHEVDQYQVVTMGGGVLGKHRMSPGTVHYTDGYTSYGPIVAGDEGLSFFTLRQHPTVGANYMPGARNRKLRRSGASFTGLASTSLPVARNGSRLLGQSPGGALAVEVNCRPGTSLSNLRSSSVCSLVVAGSLLMNGRELPVRTCVAPSENVGECRVVSGPEGAVLMLLKFRSTARTNRGKSPIRSKHPELALKEGT